MASIGSIIPPYSNTTSAANSSSSANGNSSQNNTATADPLANESTFLTLLVSQLKNQNPDSPMDGTTFVTQLAQFSDLEQNLAMRQDLDSISQKYDGSTSTTTAGTATGNSSAASGTGTSSGTTGTQS